MTAPKTCRYYWEDFPIGHRMDFGAMPVTREAVIEFARQFDPQPFHRDDETARGTLFGPPVGHNPAPSVTCCR